MRLSLSCLACIFIALTSMTASALESERTRGEFSTVRLLVGQKHAPAATEAVPASPAVLEGAIDLKLEGEWKTYWRAPGDAGFPLVLSLDPTAQNIASMDIRWPSPERFVEEWGLEVFGYKHHVVIPVLFTLKDPSVPTQADLRVSYAVCSDICINEEHHVSLAVPVEYTPTSKATQRIATAKTKVPLENGGNGLSIETAAITHEDATQGKGVLQVIATSAQNKFNKPDLFVEGPAGLRFPLPQVTLSEQGKRAEFSVPYELSLPAKTLDDAEIVLTLVNGKQAVEWKVAVRKEEKPQASQAEQDSAKNSAAVAKAMWKRLASQRPLASGQ